MTSAPRYMPDGNGGVVPAPDVLTPAEVARYLRIKEPGDAANDSANQLRTHRRNGLRVIKPGGKVRVRLADLVEYAGSLAEHQETTT